MGIACVLLSCVLQALGNLAVSEWLKRWVELNPEEQTQPPVGLTFMGIVVAFLGFSLMNSLLISSLALLQSRKLHLKMIDSLVRSASSFFDGSPTGRIVSRFGKDIGVADNLVPVVLVEFYESFFRVISIFIVLCFNNPIMVAPILAVIFFAVYLRGKLVFLTREAMKLESQSRSPITSLLSSTLEGCPLIRLYKQQTHFALQMRTHISQNANSTTTRYLVGRAFSFVLNLLNFVIIACCLLSSFFLQNSYDHLNVYTLALAAQLTLDLLNWLQ